MLDNEWTLYKTMIRKKYKNKPKELEQAEKCFVMFENTGGKLNLSAITNFAKKHGNRMTMEEKTNIVNSTQEEMKTQGVGKDARSDKA